MARCLSWSCSRPTRTTARAPCRRCRGWPRSASRATCSATAGSSFQGDLLGDSGFKGAPFAAAALGHDIHVAVSPGGTRDGGFLPSGIRWVVERLFAWLSRYRRLNIVFDREPDLFAAHVWIAMISIISRRLVAQTQAQQGV